MRRTKVGLLVSATLPMAGAAVTPAAASPSSVDVVRARDGPCAPKGRLVSTSIRARTQRVASRGRLAYGGSSQNLLTMKGVTRK